MPKRFLAEIGTKPVQVSVRNLINSDFRRVLLVRPLPVRTTCAGRKSRCPSGQRLKFDPAVPRGFGVGAFGDELFAQPHSLQPGRINAAVIDEIALHLFGP